MTVRSEFRPKSFCATFGHSQCTQGYTLAVRGGRAEKPAHYFARSLKSTAVYSRLYPCCNCLRWHLKASGIRILEFSATQRPVNFENFVTVGILKATSVVVVGCCTNIGVRPILKLITLKFCVCVDPRTCNAKDNGECRGYANYGQNYTTA